MAEQVCGIKVGSAKWAALKSAGECALKFVPGANPKKVTDFLKVLL